MPKTEFKSVDEYIAAQPEAVQDVLALVRGTIREALPKADEVISYKIPTYKLRGEPVLYFAGWKRHYSLYPVSDHVVAALKEDLDTAIRSGLEYRDALRRLNAVDRAAQVGDGRLGRRHGAGAVLDREEVAAERDRRDRNRHRQRLRRITRRMIARLIA